LLALHTLPAGQTVAHAPQFCPSEVGSTQLPAHEISPATQAHLLATQLPPLPQLTPQAPQLFASELRSRHCPLQFAKPAGHTHFPPLQLCPPPQATLQPPQLNGSVFSFTQLSPHARFGAEHMPTQVAP
jgi:hypothetical protein